MTEEPNGIAGEMEAIGLCGHGRWGPEPLIRRRRARRHERRSDQGVVLGGTATMALDESLAGFNINTSAASQFVLQEIMDMVWPQAFIVNNKLQPSSMTSSSSRP